MTDRRLSTHAGEQARFDIEAEAAESFDSWESETKHLSRGRFTSYINGNVSTPGLWATLYKTPEQACATLVETLKPLVKGKRICWRTPPGYGIKGPVDSMRYWAACVLAIEPALFPGDGTPGAMCE